jgi:thiamine biosynthesis lipoprotein
MTDITFDCMGTHARIVCGDEETATACRAFLERFDAALSRFREDSELCRLNATPAFEVIASPLLRLAVASGLWGAERTGGLVDPTLVGALEAAGYGRTRRAPELALEDALDTAPPRRPAAPHPDAHWRNVTVRERTIRRPPGVRLDTGGTGKGLAADLLATRLDGRWAVDCGGDLRVSAGEPFDVHVRHPLTRETVHTLRLSDAAVATSGVDTRLWRAEDGSPRHHLLDPATGEPAWTGVASATALAPTALEAEALAKAALLSGPAGAARWLRTHGGVVVRDDGDVMLHGPLRPRPVVRIAVAA